MFPLAGGGTYIVRFFFCFFLLFRVGHSYISIIKWLQHTWAASAELEEPKHLDIRENPYIGSFAIAL